MRLDLTTVTLARATGLHPNDLGSSTGCSACNKVLNQSSFLFHRSPAFSLVHSQRFRVFSAS